MKLNKFEDIPLINHSGHFKFAYNPVSLLIQTLQKKDNKEDIYVNEPKDADKSI